MQADSQGTRENGTRRRYQAIPRTLILLTRRQPATGRREVLLLKGAPTKRLWANLYNGLGGHVEAGEDVLSAARREVQEETELTPVKLTLRGVVNIDTGMDEQGPRPGVLMFVFTGECDAQDVPPGPEGAPAWLPVDALDNYPLVDDLYALIPLALGDGPVFYGHYSPRPDGKLSYRFSA
jgi:8-oxo-dGTP diphosphatase